jgi:hypothetical protein
MGYALGMRHAGQRLSERLPALDQHLRADLASQRHVLLEHRLIAGRLAPGGLDVDGDQLSVERPGELTGAPDQPL